MPALAFGFRRLLLAAALAAASTACGDDGASEAPPAGPPGLEIGCADDARGQAYEPGLAVPGASGRWTFVLETADPAPPAKGMNRWTLAVLEGDRSAAIDALEAVPFMPDHDHGPARAPTVEQAGERFVVDDLDFFMPGLWRVTLTGRNGAATDTAELFFCVEG